MRSTRQRTDNRSDSAGRDTETVLRETGLAQQLQRQLAECMLEAELTYHLHAEPSAGTAPANQRRGRTLKTVLTPSGPLTLHAPMDLLHTFQPQLIAKRFRHLPSWDERIINLYARGITAREIEQHLLRIYGFKATPQLISTISAELLGEIKRWQWRPLEPVYLLVYFDALGSMFRDESTGRYKPVYIAIGIDLTGRKHALSLWIEETPGTTFWLKVLNDLRHRKVANIITAAGYGLPGFQKAMEAVFPHTEIRPISGI